MTYLEILAGLVLFMAGIAVVVTIIFGIATAAVWVGEKVDHHRGAYYAVNAAMAATLVALIALGVYLLQPA